MKRCILSLIVLMSFVGGLNVVSAEEAPEKAAQKAAEVWMPLWDAGKYDESYEELAEDTKKSVTKKKWFLYWSAVRKPLGKLKSRKLVEAQYIKSLPGLPDREGVVLRYESSFENKETWVETFGMMREKDGAWRVAHYITP